MKKNLFYFFTAIFVLAMVAMIYFVIIADKSIFYNEVLPCVSDWKFMLVLFVAFAVIMGCFGNKLVSGWLVFIVPSGVILATWILPYFAIALYSSSSLILLFILMFSSSIMLMLRNKK